MNQKNISLKRQGKKRHKRVLFSEWGDIFNIICSEKLEKMTKDGYKPDFIDFSLRKWGDSMELIVYFVVEGVSPVKSTLVLERYYSFNNLNDELIINY